MTTLRATGATLRHIFPDMAAALACVLALACCLAGALPPQAVAAGGSGPAETAITLERGVKAAFLYKFLSYVEYPTALLDGSGPYVVGVAGADDIAAELSRVTAGRSINNHMVQVRVLRPGDAPGGLHLLFVGASEGTHMAALVHAAQQAGALSVTETSGGLQAGSVINFRLVEDRVRFEVSLEAADKSNLKLSSRLLSVAYAVQKGGS